MYACCCIDVDDTVDLARDEWRKANKEHRCGECGEVIKKGERYEHASLLFEGDWSTHKTCELCVRIRTDFFPCGFYYGFLREDFRECNGWDYCEMPEDEDD